MKKEKQKIFYIAIFLLATFLIWTIAICFVDVKAIGPYESTVGFASLNGFIHNFTGVHMSLYVITDWLGLVPIIFAAGFGLTGLIQWIKRRHLLKVDYDILILGIFYIVVMALYILFETVVINYRPVLINGYQEASYPSSTTMLVMSVMITVIMQFNIRIKNNIFRKCINFLIIVFIAFMIISRFLSGVHWFSDIVGSILLSSGLVTLYFSLISPTECNSTSDSRK